jgi:predicted nuclease of predicted toxin-antitoxin system
VKILFDHCVPAPLRRSFPAHEIRTAAQMGWEKLQNGRLLAAAATEFAVFLTVDKNLKHQQNLGTIQVAVVILDTIMNTLDALLPLAPIVESVLPTLRPGQIVEINGEGKITIIRSGA